MHTAIAMSTSRMIVWIRQRAFFGGLATCIALGDASASTAFAGQDSDTKVQRIALGRRLFFDARFSRDGTISCASCHRPELAYSDGLALASGIHGLKGTRNTPSLTAVGSHSVFMWDGRRQRLEQQVLEPLFNPREHGLRSRAELLKLLYFDVSYKKSFGSLYPGRKLNSDLVANALGEFIRSISQANSAFDKFYQGSTTALGDSAIRGYELFRGRAQCSSCHNVEGRVPAFTDNKFHSLGVSRSRLAGKLALLAGRVLAASPVQMESWITNDQDIAALGYFVVSRNPRDIGAFRTPSLRNVALTAPYMHDGSIASLSEAVDQELYYRNISNGQPIVLTLEEKADLIAFLYSLSDTSQDFAATR